MIRLMTTDDIPAGMRLKAAAGWNQGERDWVNVLSLEPQGCWVFEIDGRIVGSTTAVCFDRRLAWIGMVLVDPDYRRRGIARALMEKALGWLEQRRVEWIKLDATDMGRPLYEQLGFIYERPIERWERIVRTQPAAGTPHDPSAADESPNPLDLEAVRDLDLRAFGADRFQMLKRLAGSFPSEFRALPGGYAGGRPGSKAAFFGPMVADDPQTARSLLRGFLDRQSGDNVYWDLLPDNRAAVALAVDAGFERIRVLARMYKPGPAAAGERPDGDLGLIWATAGFEYG